MSYVIIGGCAFVFIFLAYVITHQRAIESKNVKLFQLESGYLKLHNEYLELEKRLELCNGTVAALHQQILEREERIRELEASAGT